MLFLLIFILLFKILFKNVYDQYGLRYSFSEYWVHYIFIVLQVSIIFIFNILVVKYEKIVVTAKIICLNIFLMIIIPVYTFLSSYIVLNSDINNMFDGLLMLLYLNSTTVSYFEYLDSIRASYFDPIDWVKLGNIIFGFVIYECLFIVYIKQNKILNMGASHNRPVCAAGLKGPPDYGRSAR
jgi:hypothetical protein